DGRQGRGEPQAGVVTVGHDQTAHESGRHSPGRGVGVLLPAVAAEEPDVVGPGEVLAEVVGGAGLGSPAVTHQRLHREGLPRPRPRCAGRRGPGRRRASPNTSTDRPATQKVARPAGSTGDGARWARTTAAWVAGSPEAKRPASRSVPTRAERPCAVVAKPAATPVIAAQLEAFPATAEGRRLR